MAVEKMSLAKALNESLRKALDTDPKVLIMGEDVGKLGGVFRITDGLQKDFGEGRVIDTPLAESGIVGTAIGLALRGYRPIVEIQFDGFVFPAYDQIVTQLAKMHARALGKVKMPVVIRIPYGGGIGAVEHHSESPEALFAHVAGLKVVSPSNASDAYWMMQQAVQSDDPIIFFEPKRRYWDKGELDTESIPGPLHKAAVAREGSDLTLVAYGPMVKVCLEAAAAAQEEGKSVEVLDLRSMSPIDFDAVQASVEKTGLLVVVHEAPVFYGSGAEIAARITERCFYHLEAPVLRVGGYHAPTRRPGWRTSTCRVSTGCSMPSTARWRTEERVVTTMTETSARFREFKMPDVGEGLTEAEILKWFVQPGDTVTDGQVVCEVETAKAAVELPIPFDGVVHELRFPEGTTVDVGEVIIAVDVAPGSGDAPAEPEPVQEAVAEPAAEEAPKGRQPVLVGYGVAESSTKRRARKGAEIPGPAAAAAQAEINGHRAKVAESRPLAKPPVRKLAKDLGIDLATVTPTGEGGVITREDVHAAAAPAPAEAPVRAEEAVAAPAPVEAVAPVGRETRIPVKGVRKAIAQAMVGSAFTAPHVTEFVTVDVTRTMKLVAELKEDKDMAGVRVNPLLVIAKALLVAIKRNPAVNAAWDEANQEIVQKHYVNLGIAAATPRGLIVPNIKDAHDKTLPELGAALADLVSTAREGKTSPAAMAGGTVTITNVGVFGVDTGTPILNPGESAILAVGAIKLQPWVHKGKVKPRQVTTLALSFDHRLVDGELGSKVLADVAAILEQPKRLITWG